MNIITTGQTLLEASDIVKQNSYTPLFADARFVILGIKNFVYYIHILNFIELFLIFHL